MPFFLLARQRTPLWPNQNTHTMSNLRRLFALSVKVKKIYPDAHLPTKAHEHDAGFDLYAHRVERAPFQVKYHTGIAVQIPEGYVGLLFPRSSVTKTRQQMANSVGVVDAGYTGEITVVFNQPSPLSFPYDEGDRVAQLVIMPIPKVELKEVAELDPSKRGAGGFGSTGK